MPEMDTTAQQDKVEQEMKLKAEETKAEASGNRLILNVQKDIPIHPSIQEIFVGKSVLVTGATGFLGKVLLEKLLRSCPGITEIFVLIRQSKKGSVESRLNDLRQHSVFNRLREGAPNTLNKLRGLSGDVTLDSIGLSGWQLRKVINEVSFIFHCAANVRFDDKPKNTMSTNLVGVQNVLTLCKSCVKLEAIVHVSTAYTFCNHAVIAEQVYPEMVKPQQVIDTVKWMDNEQLYILCMYYIQNRPSIYQFSKALAETLIVETSKNLPIIIVRPSIVTASVAEPYPGWIDNYNGPSGFINVCGRGVVKTLLVGSDVNADWVPVDIVANTLIAAAHYIVTKNSFQNPVRLLPTNEVPIINCTCPDHNIITWNKVVDICLPLLKKYPPSDLIAKPGGTVTSSPFVYFMCRIIYHYVPALFMDLFSCLVWKKPRMIRLYNSIHRVMSRLEYYTTHSFTFSSGNMRKLVDHMDPNDRKVFPIDQGVLNWNSYMENYVLGVRRYFLHEDDENLPVARKRMMRLNCFWMFSKLSSIAGVLMFMRFLYRRGALKRSLLASFSVFAVASTRLQNKFHVKQIAE